jgi:hypothetical protein
MEEFSVPVVLAKFPGFYVQLLTDFSPPLHFTIEYLLYQGFVMVGTVFSIRLVYISVNCVYFQRAVTFPC